MNIEHVAIYVNNLEVVKNFFVKYFGAKPSEKYTNFRQDFSSYFLVFDNGSRFEIMHRSTMIDPKKAKYRSGYHHVALNVGGKKDVDELTAKIEDDGFFVVAAPRTTGDGYYASIVTDPEGNEIELLAGNVN
ncbi:MAG: VOC family protein [Quinella sp. 3Q1]|nr:VOC family protein [Quinella sp. 3Q1]MBE8952873.1 VOC family protein [Quinella sp. 1Q7]